MISAAFSDADIILLQSSVLQLIAVATTSLAGYNIYCIASKKRLSLVLDYVGLCIHGSTKSYNHIPAALWKYRFNGTWNGGME